MLIKKKLKKKLHGITLVYLVKYLTPYNTFSCYKLVMDPINAADIYLYTELFNKLPSEKSKGFIIPGSPEDWELVDINRLIRCFFDVVADSFESKTDIGFAKVVAIRNKLAPEDCHINIHRFKDLKGLIETNYQSIWKECFNDIVIPSVEAGRRIANQMRNLFSVLTCMLRSRNIDHYFSQLA